MNIIKADSVITAAWDQVFRGDVIPDAWASDLGLYFNVEIGVENFGYERDGNTYHEEWARQFFRSVEFVVTARHEVFVKKSENHVPSHEALSCSDWANTSNHDSCWRSDGLREIWETLREGYQYCWDHVPEEHRVSMRSMHHHCSVNTGVFSRGLLQFVRVTSQADPKRSGWRQITSLKKVGFKLTVEE